MTDKMPSLTDFLGDITKNYQQDIDKARSGSPSGAWDGPAMPLNQEYRVVVDRCTFGLAKQSGRPQLTTTFMVVEPEEFSGRMVQTYWSCDKTNDRAMKDFATNVGALKPDVTGLGPNDWEILANRYVGCKAVITLNTWGDANDRYGVRWINQDRNQLLKDTIAAPKPKTDSRSLRPDVVIRKAETASWSDTNDDHEDVEAPKKVELPGSARPAGGPNLPPGIKR